MIFSTFNQFNCFIIFLFLGLICRLIYNLFSIIFLKNYKKIKIKIIFDLFFYIFFNFLLIFLIFYLNFGKIDFAIILAFLIGNLWVKKLTKNLVVFLEKKWYTFINKNFIRNNKNAAKSKKS